MEYRGKQGIVVFVCALLTACSPGPTPACTPGATVACACAGGASGTQACLDDGTGYGTCTGCPASTQCGSRVCGSDGAGGTCGTCSTGQRCSGNGTCEIDPTSHWLVTLTSGNVATQTPSGDAWDILGGAPCPKVCLTIAGVQTCSPFISDSFTPVWNFPFPVATAAALEAGITASYLDDDTTTDDEICGAGTITFGAADFAAGTRQAGCPSGHFTLSLTPR